MMNGNYLLALGREWLAALDRNDIRVEQAVSLGRQLPMLFAGNMVAALVVAVAVIPYSELWRVGIMVGVVWLVVAPMVLTWRRVRHRAIPATVSRRHVLRVIAHSAMLGLTWAAVIQICLPRLPFSAFAILAAGSTFLNLSAAAALAINPLACIAYAAPIAVAGIVLVLRSANPAAPQLLCLLLLMDAVLGWL